MFAVITPEYATARARVHSARVPRVDRECIEPLQIILEKSAPRLAAVAALEDAAHIGGGIEVVGVTRVNQHRDRSLLQPGSAPASSRIRGLKDAAGRGSVKRHWVVLIDCQINYITALKAAIRMKPCCATVGGLEDTAAADHIHRASISRINCDRRKAALVRAMRGAPPRTTLR